MSKVAITVRSGRNGEIHRFNRITRRNSSSAYEAIGTQVLLFSPRDDARHGYFGVATLRAVELDVTNNLFLLVDLAAIRLFSVSVPLTFQSHPYERDAEGPNGEVLWWYYSTPARTIDEAAFNSILTAASAASEIEGNRDTKADQPGIGEKHYEFIRDTSPGEPDFRLSRQLARSSRLRTEVLLLHGPVCALTDRCLVSPEGIAEVEVCHIRPLASGGPDIVRNALPMNRTVHWGFDLGLVSLNGDGTILIAACAGANFRHYLSITKLRANFPRDPNLWPDPDFIDYHRGTVFKGL